MYIKERTIGKKFELKIFIPSLIEKIMISSVTLASVMLAIFANVRANDDLLSTKSNIDSCNADGAMDCNLGTTIEKDQVNFWTTMITSRGNCLILSKAYLLFYLKLVKNNYYKTKKYNLIT